jgi:hypothetical protein
MNQYYILVNTRPITVGYIEWTIWFQAANRRVAETEVGCRTVSTVFLGLDHQYTKGGPPLLFETIVFPECDICERYSTWNDAEQGHDRLVQQLRLQLQTLEQMYEKQM